MIALLIGLLAFVPPVQDERWYLTDEEVELFELIDTCSKGLGVALDYDRALVQGRVTIRSEGGYTSEGLWALANRLSYARHKARVTLIALACLKAAKLRDEVVDRVFAITTPWPSA